MVSAALAALPGCTPGRLTSNISCAQVRPLLEGEEVKKAKTCCHVQNDQTVVLSPRGTTPGPAGPDSERLAFQMERAYLLNSLIAERRLFNELIHPLLDRFLAGFNATVSSPRVPCTAACSQSHSACPQLLASTHSSQLSRAAACRCLHTARRGLARRM